jgi:hypothetical protein
MIILAEGIKLFIFHLSVDLKKGSIAIKPMIGNKTILCGLIIKASAANKPDNTNRFLRLRIMENNIGNACTEST